MKMALKIQEEPEHLLVPESEAVLKKQKDGGTEKLQWPKLEQFEQQNKITFFFTIKQAYWLVIVPCLIRKIKLSMLKGLSY